MMNDVINERADANQPTDQLPKEKHSAPSACCSGSFAKTGLELSKTTSQNLVTDAPSPCGREGSPVENRKMGK